MGLDAEFFIHCPRDIADRITREVVAWGWPCYTFIDTEDEAGIVAVTIGHPCRYFGPLYERGHWPDIRRDGNELRRLVPRTLPMSYGHDCLPPSAGMPWVAVYLDEIDALWARHTSDEAE